MMTSCLCNSWEAHGTWRILTTTCLSSIGVSHIWRLDYIWWLIFDLVLACYYLMVKNQLYAILTNNQMEVLNSRR